MEVVVAALVTAVGGIITTLLLKVKHENTKDHASVMEILRSVGGKVEKIDSKLDAHIDWHLKGASSGQIPDRNKKSASRTKQSD
jgi:hypothetical protein